MAWLALLNESFRDLFFPQVTIITQMRAAQRPAPDHLHGLIRRRRSPGLTHELDQDSELEHLRNVFCSPVTRWRQEKRENVRFNFGNFVCQEHWVEAEKEQKKQRRRRRNAEVGELVNLRVLCPFYFGFYFNIHLTIPRCEIRRRSQKIRLS